MKFVKGIGLFFEYPLTMLAIGFYAGAEAYRFFYPGVGAQYVRMVPETDIVPTPEDTVREKNPDGEPQKAVEEDQWPTESLVDEALSVTSSMETLYVGTQYVLEETDIDRHTVVETSWSLPDKYVGMNREQFLQAMAIYQASPPLKELERGFVGLEVLSFSRERVVVQMNYSYVQPSKSFYLAVYNNEVLVYLEDRETVYIETKIRLDSLPDEVQREIIQMMLVESEEELYNFLETYSS